MRVITKLNRYDYIKARTDANKPMTDNIVELEAAREDRAKREKRKFGRLFDGADLIRNEDAWAAGEVAFVNRVMVQATLPYREPKDNPAVWGRRAGNVSLVIQPGMYLRTVKDEKGREVGTEPASLGFPYGAKPRLILAWLGREAKRQKSREIELGSSLSQFLDELGIEHHSGGKNGSITKTREQMIRLFAARIAMVSDFDAASGSMATDSMAVADTQQLWWNPINPDKPAKFQSCVKLSERFYDELLHGVPVDMRALRALRASPFELDLYCWLTYRMFTLSRVTKIPWEALQLQFGSQESNPRKFKFQIRKALKSVLVVYPEARVTDGPEGLVISPSKTSVLANPMSR